MTCLSTIQTKWSISKHMIWFYIFRWIFPSAMITIGITIISELHGLHLSSDWGDYSTDEGEVETEVSVRRRSEPVLAAARRLWSLHRLSSTADTVGLSNCWSSPDGRPSPTGWRHCLYVRGALLHSLAAFPHGAAGIPASMPWMRDLNLIMHKAK